MNASELAVKMLQWEEQKSALDVLEKEIENAVLNIGKTQTVGNVRATYSNGRKKYNYLTPGSEADKEIIDKNSSVLIDWRQVCIDAEIEPILEAQGEPSVRVKLLD